LNGFHPLDIEFPIHFSINQVTFFEDCKYVILIRDLTEQRAAGKKVRERHDVLLHFERLNTLSGMATGITQKIDQPLTAHSMYAEAGLRSLQQPESASDRLHKVLDTFSTQAHRTGAVIERMQEVTKQRDSRRKATSCYILIRVSGFWLNYRIRFISPSPRLGSWHGHGIISRSIIAAHGGQLECANSKAAGATFYFTLSSAVEHADD
jgi:C4-dicarboxylate-specific signal transduction histidine kinase